MHIVNLTGLSLGTVWDGDPLWLADPGPRNGYALAYTCIHNKTLWKPLMTGMLPFVADMQRPQPGSNETQTGVSYRLIHARHWVPHTKFGPRGLAMLQGLMTSCTRPHVVAPRQSLSGYQRDR